MSHEWIYQYSYKDKQRKGNLWRCLRQSKRRYHKGNGRKRTPIPDAVSIEERPAIIDERSCLGDWKADLVLGQQGTDAIVTLAERCSLYLIKKVPSKEASVVSQAIIEMLSDYKTHCFTLTFDNGGEFSEHKKIAEALEADTYFAHPYSTYERGLNENFNGLLRQYIPKGTDLRTITDEQLQPYQDILNNRPRKCLGFKTPQVVFNELKNISGVALRS